jgi:hypothetical protein
VILVNIPFTAINGFFFTGDKSSNTLESTLLCE